VIDKEAIIDSVPEGSGTPLYSLIPPHHTFWYTDDINTWGRGMSQPERLEAAVGVLSDAGYTWTTRPQAVTDEAGAYTGEIIPGEDLTQPDGTPMPTLELLTPGPTPEPLRQVQGEWIVAFAAPLGITIDWQLADSNTIVGLTFPPQEDGLGWDMYTMGWSSGVDDLAMPCLMHQAYFDADNDATAGGLNMPGYSDPDFEALSDAFDAAASLNDAKEICAEMERNIADNLPYIVLWTNPRVEVWRSHIELPFAEIYGGTAIGNGLIGSVRARG
jgi:ABC-type transport system substrate-binding protein